MRLMLPCSDGASAWQRRAATSLLLCLLLGLTSGEAHGQSGDAAEAASALFQEGLRDMKAEAYDQACPRLAKSLELDPRMGTLFTLAECEARSGALASSFAHFGEFLERAKALAPEEHERQEPRIVEAKRRRAGLEARVPRLSIEVSSDAPADAQLLRGDTTVPRRQWGTAMPVDPGRHRIVLRATDGRESEAIVELQPGEREVVKLSLRSGPQPAPSPAPKTTPPPAAPADTTGQQVAAWISLGFGAAGMITAGAATIVLLGKQDTVDANCDGSACNPVGFAEAESVPTLSAIGTVGFAVGAAGLALGTVLLLTLPDTEEATRVGLGARGTPLGLNFEQRW
jgi:hypothetical protein